VGVSLVFALGWTDGLGILAGNGEWVEMGWDGMPECFFFLIRRPSVDRNRTMYEHIEILILFEIREVSGWGLFHLVIFRS
jgi:hypothetical protein